MFFKFRFCLIKLQVLGFAVKVQKLRVYCNVVSVQFPKNSNEPLKFFTLKTFLDKTIFFTKDTG